MSEAHDEMRKRLTAYREAKALYESPDPYDREEARYDAMHAARARLCDEALAEALLDEHDRLNEALGLAYPRALQAAADVVLNADLSLFDDEASGLGWLDDVANCILELTEEQIEAFDAQVEREYAAAVAPKPERPVVIWHYRNDEEELPSCDDPDEALVNAIDDQAGLVYVDDSGTQRLEEPHLLDDEITLYGYARMEVKVDGERILESVLENLDEDHAAPGGDGTSPTPAMIEAAHAFAIAIEDGYESWACEVVEKRVVNVREWCAANAPEWLAQLTALDDEEGGDHG